MTLFLLNLVLAALWLLLWGEFNVYTMIVGLVGGYVVLFMFTRVVRRDLLRDAYGGRLWALVSFAFHFAWLLIKSNLTLAREIMTPGFTMTPRILRYSVAGLSDPEIVALSNAITLTPGTLVVDISRDKRWLYIHCMYAQDRAAAIADIHDLRRRMERQVFYHLEPRPPREAAK